MLARMRSAAWLAGVALAVTGCSGNDAAPGAGGRAGSSSGGTAGSSGTGGSGGGAAGWPGGSGGAAGSAGSCDATAPSIARLGSTFDVPTLDAASPKRNPDIAYDELHDVYLVVTGATVISGTFIDPDGTTLAPPFAVAQTAAYTQTPRVVYGAGKLLVVWHDARTDPNSPELWARFVRFNSGAPDLQATDFPVSIGGHSYQEMGAGLAYSATSQLFLVVWQAVPDNDLRARRVDTNGSLVGDEIQITADPDWQSGAAVAWSSANDEFLVTYANADASGASVRAQRIRASDGALLGAAIPLATAGGTWTTGVAYLPCDNRYVVGWVSNGASGIRTSAGGEPDGAPFSFPSGYGYPDGFALARSPALDTLAAVMHGPTDEDFAVAFTASGDESAVLQATDNAGSDGHFNPRIAANGARAEWMMVTSLGFTTIVGQRLGP